MANEPVPVPVPAAAPSSSSPLGNSVIPIVNKLQDIFAQLGSQSTIELPQVAVVGSQSSGKSSVLEALVGRDFLPRGSDICTRRPLVLQLLQTKTSEEYGEFLHIPGKKFHDFSEIRREIRAETDREAGGNKGVSDKQISLKIFSPNVLDITLVDLPGITKVPVGDQPSDIEARIRTMIMSYIKVPSCLILAVTPANSDLANSDALQIAGNADPDGLRTIGIITKLDIMDRGTDARNLLSGKVIPLQLGYFGVVNRSQEDILLNRSIKDALTAEEKFFRSHSVYDGLADCCGVPQLAKKLNQILVQHIKKVLPGLKSRISSALVSTAKEHASFGDITESKAGQGALLLNILSKYSEAFSSMVEGKNEGMSTSELEGGARIHYIFQSIFVKSLEEVDPCEDLTDDDIRTAIQNATGPKSALFVPEVPFEVLIRKQIARLLDPSLQCARFIYDELIKISHCCVVNELQRFPILRKRMDEVIGNFLLEGLEPSETIIGHIIDMEMDYINTSHPNFLGGSKAVEIAMQQVKSSRISLPISRQKDGAELDKATTSERSLKSRGILGRQVNGIVADQAIRPLGEGEKVALSGNTGSSSWGFSSIFRSSDNRTTVKENSSKKSYDEPLDGVEQSFSMIHLREPPTVLRPSESHTEQEAIEIAITKLILRSYYDIVRKNIEDAVPKAIMHFLVNHTKRELHSVFIRKIYRENLFEEMLQESDDVAVRRKLTRETLRVLQQAFQTLDELPLEAERVERGYSVGVDPTGLPKIRGLPASSMYSTSSSGDSYSASPKNPKSRNTGSSSWGFSSIFGSSDNRTTVKENSSKKSYDEPLHGVEQSFSMIHLREPPTVLRPSESHTEQEAIEIAITKLLLRSYYDIVRKNIEDAVPKAIMHFLVNHTKRELHSVFIRKLYRENLFEEMLQESDDVAVRRKRTRETLRVLQQAFQTLDELPLEAERVERGYSVGVDPTGLPKIRGLPASSMYSTSSSGDSYSASPKNPKSRKSSHSGELLSPFHSNVDSNGSGYPYTPGHYPAADL